MLNIFLGDEWNERENVVMAPQIYFDNVYEDSWINDQFAKDVILDVDGSVVIDDGVVKSKVFGSIPITRISGGAKTIILVKNDKDYIMNISACGDNCAKWLLKIGEQQDATVRLGYIMEFNEDFKSDDVQFSINIINLNRIVHNQREFVQAFFEVKNEGKI
jgi:hypothetical protein